MLGRFESFLEEQFCWFLETFRFLKGRSRVFSLADYNVEKRLVLAVPLRMLRGSQRSFHRSPHRKYRNPWRGGNEQGTAHSEALKSKDDIPT
jgi:hypothetical protein